MSTEYESQVVREAYESRATEYTKVLGSIEAMSPVDLAAIEGWSRGIDGRIVDAGCGPGHWTAHLRNLGADIEGIDMVPAFIDGARSRFPDTAFRLGDLDALPVKSASLAGILAWYSLIHVSPDLLSVTIQEFARCLEPGGRVLLGFFEGQKVEAFGHAVTTAYFWPVEEMARLLADARFEVTEVRTRADPGARPHAAIAAQLSH
ncbi:class I SAM-dependent methyltransferase [Glutamicibacter sp. MNS18]|uniref:class I SAM-dependent DNA methyltransferase n=1 Tax=Glutamicibacter sp. MNS18 TaxID=2989817 RepID=UPI0022369C00|nr:class I SAM-dependent methyltransferase [Glutamicibacter sp. MNS18]MCW4464253.1 class I SAM-dependent methyltransferase [Glutamicibacter sp. MNS18]